MGRGPQATHTMTTRTLPRCPLHPLLSPFTYPCEFTQVIRPEHRNSFSVPPWVRKKPCAGMFLIESQVDPGRQAKNEHGWSL